MELQDSEGNTALMYAAAFGHEDIVSLILSQMGRLRRVLHLNQRNYRGLTAAQLAAQNGHHRVVSALDGSRPLYATFDKKNFPDPTQLDRSSTPSSPFPTFQSFQNSARWMTVRYHHLSNGDDDEDLTLKSDEKKNSHKSIYTADMTNESHLFQKCELPRLWLKDTAFDSNLLRSKGQSEQESSMNNTGSRHPLSIVQDGKSFLPSTNGSHIKGQLSYSKHNETQSFKEPSRILNHQIRNNITTTDNELLVRAHHRKQDREWHFPPIRPFLTTILPSLNMSSAILQIPNECKVIPHETSQTEQLRDKD